MRQSVAGFVVTHLQGQRDDEEDQRCRHCHVSFVQQDFFPCALNNHKLQERKNIVSSEPHGGAITTR